MKTPQDNPEGYIKSSVLSKIAQFRDDQVSSSPSPSPLNRFILSIYLSINLLSIYLFGYFPFATGNLSHRPFSFLFDSMQLLLVHGTADNNVHLQNSLELVKLLVKSGIQFRSMYYPNKDHGISGDNARPHLYKMLSNYVKEKVSTAHS